MMLHETPHRSGRDFVKKNKFLLLFVCIYLLLSIFLFDPKLNTGGDNAVYIILAESIAGGKGYRNVHLPEEPPHTQYPPGFPLLLALPILIFGSNIIILKCTVLLMGVGSVFFMYRIGECLIKEKINIIMPFYLSIPLLIEFNHWILSEVPFLCFSLGAVYFFIKARAHKEYFYYISFIFATYSVFIRAAGISLIIAMLLFLLLKKQYKYMLILLLIFLVVFVPWQIRNMKIPHEGGYLEQLLAKRPYWMESGRVGFRDLIIRGWNNFVFYAALGLPLTLLAPIASPWILGILGLIFMILIIVGVLERRKHFSIIELYLPLGLLILLVWPEVWSNERFLLPLLPIFVIYIFFGLFWLERRIKVAFFVPLVTGLFVFLNVMSIGSKARGMFTNNIEYLKGNTYAGYTPDWRHYFSVIEWIKENVPEDELIMSRKPEFVYFLSKHKSFAHPFSLDQDKVEEAFERSDYIILDNFRWTIASKNYLRPVIEKQIERIQFVYITEKPRFYLIKVEK
jgi:hypothetical protein